jgi:NAD(P)-dependent dehydrogenase (short-subunit alcohol dehydrogenase family)
MPFLFSNPQPIQAVIIGANRGIGLGFVRHLLADPRVGTLYGTYRHRDRAQDLLQLAQSGGDRLIPVQLDVTDESQLAQWSQTLSQQEQSLHLLINCVGVLHDGDQIQPEKSLRQIDGDRLLQYFRINSIPSVLLAKHLMPLFRHNQPSVFASISAKVGSIGDNYLGGWYGYRASKAALNMLMHTTAIEYSRRCPQTCVVCLHPGTTDTDLSKPFQRNVPPDKLFPVEKTVRQLMQVIEDLSLDHSGQFFSWDGTPLPW